MSETQMNYGLSVIDGIEIQSVAATMAKIAQFQKIVQSQLKQNHDFGIIPGTPKPTLLKPGAEKILMLLGLRSEFNIIDSMRDFDKGFFQYQVCCSLYKNNALITQGLGAANNRETKYLKLDPYTVDNTILKMAKKRALVDAALLVGSLSDIFTQDLEDLDITGQQASQGQRVYTDQDGTISKAQAKRMYAIADGDVELIKSVMAKYKYQRSDDVQKIDYEKICQEITDRKQARNEAEMQNIAKEIGKVFPDVGQG